MKYIGGLFIVIGLVILGLTFWPVAKQEITYQALPPMSEVTPVDANLGVVIPKIGANAKIVPEVDPYDSRIYQRALMLGVAHAKGTPLPGDSGTSFLFSHSSVDFFRATQYNSVFYLLSKLDPGDPIFIYRDGQKLTFTVTDKQILAADRVDLLNPTTGEAKLLLMTCWPPGTGLKRLVVSAMLDR